MGSTLARERSHAFVRFVRSFRSFVSFVGFGFPRYAHLNEKEAANREGECEQPTTEATP